jgi:hypothetical protein
MGLGLLEAGLSRSGSAVLAALNAPDTASEPIAPTLFNKFLRVFFIRSWPQEVLSGHSLAAQLLLKREIVGVSPRTVSTGW